MKLFAGLFVVLLLLAFDALAQQGPSELDVQQARAVAAEVTNRYLQLLLQQVQERDRQEAAAKAQYWKEYVEGLGKK